MSGCEVCGTVDGSLRVYARSFDNAHCTRCRKHAPNDSTEPQLSLKDRMLATEDAQAWEVVLQSSADLLVEAAAELERQGNRPEARKAQQMASRFSRSVESALDDLRLQDQRGQSPFGR